MIYFLYHKNCLDGYGSAIAAYLKFKLNAQYIPVQHQEPVPELEPQSQIYLLDFCYPRAVMETLKNKHQVIVLDHHKTALEDMTGMLGLKDSVFDLQRSGAMITWEYFHPQQPIPQLFKLIQDRDLWQWKYAETGAVTAVLMTLGYEDFQTWLPYLEDQQIAELANMGQILLNANAQNVKNQLSMSYLGKLPGKTELMPLVNTPHLISDTCHAMLCADKYQDCPVVAAWFTKQDKVCYSLRSRPGFDCSKLAQEYGGGGHPQASGFTSVEKPN